MLENSAHELKSSRWLTKDEAAARLERFGPNRLPEPMLPGLLQIFLRQFLSPFIYILLLAAFVSFFLGQLSSAIFILAVLLINAVIGSIQEFSAQKSAVALRNMVRGEALVCRDGEILRIDIEEVVPGDLVYLSSGNKVPADMRLLKSSSLSINESMLTGESLAVIKDPAAHVEEDTPLSERKNTCFAGSTVTHGRGEGFVTSTGLNTEIGKIAHMVGDAPTADPPLIIRTRRFTFQISLGIAGAICLLILLMLMRGGYSGNEILMMAIGLAVSVIPEGLPAALTVALAIGMHRMAKRSVIIRRLVAVEALGSSTFICSDKTGTLTVNELTIRKVILPNGVTFDISGEGVAPGGSVMVSRENGVKLTSGCEQRLKQLCTTGLLANESHLNYAGQEWDSNGDIVDVAFLVLAKKIGLSLTGTRNTWTQLELIPYESERAFSGSLNCSRSQAVLNVKGSPEKILEMCSMMQLSDAIVPINRQAIEVCFETLAEQGYRVLALAERPVENDHSMDELINMTFLGMVAMIDPVRPEARGAIRRCREGGIQVAMVTGDHPVTARAIASELGLCKPDDDVVTGKMIHSAGLLGKAQLDALINPARVFARIEPVQKEQIVESFIRAGHFVAVTGDGVNDAPAMRVANVGVAMGRRGTDVVKEIGDLIITDDNFASIVDGIEQGRIVYNNIRKVIGLLTATGFSALLLFFVSVASGFPMPLIAVQLLWLNLVANGLQDVALAFEPKEGGELQAQARNPAEPIFDRFIIEHMLVTGTAMGLLAFGTLAYLIKSGYGATETRNLTLMLLVLFGNIHALSSRSEVRSLFKIKFFGNPFLILAVPFAQLLHITAMYIPGLSNVLELKPISLVQWASLLSVALILLLVEEIHKWTLRYRRLLNEPT